MFAGGQFELGGGLPFAKVNVVVVGRDNFTSRCTIDVNQNVQVACAVVDFAGGFDDKVFGSH